MGIIINSLQIVINSSGNESILTRIKTLLTTPLGTVVFDREFGVDWSILDLPINQAKARLTVEYITKLKKYIPEVKVKEITFLNDSISGMLIPRVVLESV